MSYILDALRKSDQQRQRGAAPTLLTAQVAAAETRPSENWVYGLIAAVLVGAGILIGWLQPWRSEQSSAPEKQIAGAPVSGDAIAARPADAGAGRMTPLSAPSTAVPPASPAPVPPSPAAAAPVTALPDVNARPAPERPIPKPAQPASAPAAASTGAAATQHGSAGAPASAESAPESKVLSMGELPPSILQELPAMQISLHLHSTKPANRFVSINNQMLQEGAYPAPGLKLEQITPEGMVFSYKGYRFRRGVQ